MQPEKIAGLLDELEKIGASYMASGFMQKRTGRRPIRVSTLTQRDQVSQDPENEPAEPPEADGSDKEAADKGLKTKALESFAGARPYVASGVRTAVPAAVLGNMAGGRKAGIALGTIGGALGVTNEALKSWAEKNKRKAVAKKILGD